VVQVTPEAQLGAGSQAGQASGGPETLYRPAAQPAHCELPAPLQVSPEEQPVMGGHTVQTRSLLLVHAVASWVPAAQGLLQAAQTSTVPSTRYVPPAQDVHCWSLAVVQARPALQPLMGAQGVQTRSVLLVQAVVSRVPGAQAPAQATQVLLPVRWKSAGQLVHSLALAPLQVVQPGAQFEQTRSELARQAVPSNVPAGQAPEQDWHCVPSKNFPAPQLEHWASLEPVQVTVEVQPATGLHAEQASVAPLTR
jgi:hypothetical protein